MEELLLPSAEEETEHGPAGGARRSSVREQARSFLRDRQQLKTSLHAFFKQNGLLMLSVVAVVTGCSLGFVLRGTQLSTQVPHSRSEEVPTLLMVGWAPPRPCPRRRPSPARLHPSSALCCRPRSTSPFPESC